MVVGIVATKCDDRDGGTGGAASGGRIELRGRRARRRAIYVTAAVDCAKNGARRENRRRRLRAKVDAIKTASGAKRQWRDCADKVERVRSETMARLRDARRETTRPPETIAPSGKRATSRRTETTVPKFFPLFSCPPYPIQPSFKSPECSLPPCPGPHNRRHGPND